jgi:hypothetical protein
MSTNLQIIEDALRDINVISEIESASPEQGQHGLRKLNQMMEASKEMGVDIGWFSQTLTTATAPIPDWAELGITAGLSIAMAPKYGASISVEIASIADTFTSMIQRKIISERMKNADMSHMPTGEGDYYSGRSNILTGI